MFSFNLRVSVMEIGRMTYQTEELRELFSLEPELSRSVTPFAQNQAMNPKTSFAKFSLYTQRFQLILVSD